MQQFLTEYKPDYIIKKFSEDVFGIVRFNRHNNSLSVGERADSKFNDGKLDNAFSRARSMVLQYGLCNSWDYFVTFTLDKTKYDRYDLDRFKLDLSQFIRDMRKKYGSVIQFVFVPEMHHDGAWHMHGLISGIPEDKVCFFERGKHPEFLVRNGFLNWPDYADRFGFVSFGRIRDAYSTVLYVVKYIDKSVKELSDQKGKCLYMCSRGLKTAVHFADVYGYKPELEELLDWHGPFVLLA